MKFWILFVKEYNYAVDTIAEAYLSKPVLPTEESYRVKVEFSNTVELIQNLCKVLKESCIAFEDVDGLPMVLEQVLDCLDNPEVNEVADPNIGDYVQLGRVVNGNPYVLPAKAPKEKKVKIQVNGATFKFTKNQLWQLRSIVSAGHSCISKDGETKDCRLSDKFFMFVNAVTTD